MNGLFPLFGTRRTWPASAGLALGLLAGTAVFDAGAHIAAPTGAPTTPLLSLSSTLERLVAEAEPPGSADPDPLAGILPEPTARVAASATVADPTRQGAHPTGLWPAAHAVRAQPGADGR